MHLPARHHPTLRLVACWLGACAALLLVALGGTPAQAQPGKPPQREAAPAQRPAQRAGSRPGLRAQVQTIVDTHFGPLIADKTPNSERAPGGIAAVYLQGERFFFPFGRMNEDGVAPSRDTVFALASVTKVLTTSILGQEPALFHTPVARYAPKEFKLGPKQRAVTFAQLATFTGGVSPSDPDNCSGKRNSQSCFVSFINSRAPAQLPTAAPDYSNSSIGLMGQVLIGQTSPQRYDTAEAAQAWYVSKLFTPLGMAFTSTAPPKTDARHPLATGYEFDPRKQAYTPVEYNGWCPWGTAGRVFSTADDMLNFIMANTGAREIAGRSVPPEVLQGMVEALTPRVPMKNERRGNQQAFAWIAEPVDPATKSSTRFKNGGLPGVSSAVLVNPERKFGVVLLLNMFGVRAVEAGKDIMDALLPLSAF